MAVAVARDTVGMGTVGDTVVDTAGRGWGMAEGRRRVSAPVPDRPVAWGRLLLRTLVGGVRGNKKNEHNNDMH